MSAAASGTESRRADVERLRSAAARYDFVYEKGHGCAPIPFDDQKIAEVQKLDLRCTKK